MSVIQEKAAAIQQKLKPLDETIAFDPAMIMVIMQVIMQVLAAIQGCQKKPEEVPKMARSPGILGRWRLRRTIRQTISDDEMHEFAGPALTKAVLEVGASLTPDEAKKMFAEAGLGTGE